MPSSNKKTRERELSKQAARRAAERRRYQRQRITAGVTGAVVTAAALTVVYFAFLRSSNPAATPTPRPTPTATPSPSPSAPATGFAACGFQANAGQQSGPNGPVPPPTKFLDRDKSYTAVVKTSMGTFQMELFATQTPCTVTSFVYLADRKFYDGLTFHRISQSPDVIQGGDPTGTGAGGPGYSFGDELDTKFTYEIGTIAMANSGPNTNGSQWFIVTGKSGTTLPKNYTIFGKVTEGLSVVKKINDVPVKGGSGADAEQPVTPVTIQKITIKVSAPS
jgi:cyclophilin family peptidyl-prolyl cis-trans isomerase